MYRFTGDPAGRPGTAHRDSPAEPEPYVASANLIEAVNLAIYLRRPLLLEGEAGCGKTRLARAVAYELGLPYYAWPVRSTSRAQEGLYSYDAVLRLHDVQTARLPDPADRASPGEIGNSRDPRNPREYRRLGALGKAFALQDCPAVVLIDEIDKADLDFPNDLLTVLDEPWRFDIPETGETVAAAPGCTPIVFITSNSEKGNLPAPFLRRCVYHYVEFPDDPERLRAIVQSHYRPREQAAPPAELVEAAVGRFQEVRRDAELFKRPGTSELLDWLEALRNFGGRPYDPGVLREAKGRLPYPGLLFKLRNDFHRFRNAP
jgi:MoxR-like ATPase